MTARKTSSPPQPPAAAVAADAHWTATRDKLRNRARPTTSLTICDDPDLKKQMEESKFVVRRLQAQAEADPSDTSLTRDLDAAQKTLTDVQAAFDEAAIVLRFQAMRRPDFEDLKKEHPPTEAQAEDNLIVNLDTIGPPLVAASSLDGITEDDAAYYLEEWGEGEAAALFNAAWNVQSNTRMDLGKG
ncbi:hypothetical protein [Streptomyces sp. NPDC101249]|uniref:hypothetical protein n=1 Tax=Streptomyces sp. NPDC101249 TaxID=3366140 RepID=UPI00380FFC61